MSKCNGSNCQRMVETGKKVEPNAAEEPHGCPYAEEIVNDYETLCDCCNECARECLYDI